ncbi:hypothetical protein BDQ17DRAFT_646801 [Cyathus striatus]|nr:hypothetical protein BDQ17DRAFT_646801 [Cyathus striatus]
MPSISTHTKPFYPSPPIFRGLVPLPQPELEGDFKPPLVLLSEHSSTLDPLLRLCYPVKDLDVKELSMAANILVAAIKYQMDEAAGIMKDFLLKSCPLLPVEVYGIACRPSIGDEELARSAAQEWINKATWRPSYSVTFVRLWCQWLI